MSSSEEDVNPSANGKRTRNPEFGKSNVKKRIKLSVLEDEVIEINCTHNKKFSCDQLTSDVVKEARSQFLACATKAEKDAYLLKHMEVLDVVRHRAKDPSKSSRPPKGFTCKYFMPVDGERLTVCLGTITKIFSISKKKLNAIALSYLKTGDLPKDGRGSKLSGRKAEVPALPCSETYYSQSSSLLGMLATWLPSMSLAASMPPDRLLCLLQDDDDSMEKESDEVDQEENLKEVVTNKEVSILEHDFGHR